MYKYDSFFFDQFENTSLAAANEMLPPILAKLRPRSVVDFGCGEGVWLSVIKNISNEIEILGIDGDYVEDTELKIPSECFMRYDISKPLSIKTTDLAISIEVAEHIEEGCSDILIDNITKCSDNVLFSAAIPGQGGVHHINEQWQEYWIDKFEKRGYKLDLSVRDHFWRNEKITPWRRQNILFFSKDDICLFPEAKPVRSVAHPEMFRLKVNNINNSVYYK